MNKRGFCHTVFLEIIKYCVFQRDAMVFSFLFFCYNFYKHDKYYNFATQIIVLNQRYCILYKYVHQRLS